MDKIHIFVVDDDRSFLTVLSYQVKEMGFEVSSFLSPVEAFEQLEDKAAVDAVITDLRMPQMDGMEFLKRITSLGGDLPVIVLTAHGSIDAAVQATKKGAFAFLTKPFEKEELEQTLRSALKLTTLQRENERLNQALRERFRFEGIIGASTRFREVLRMAEQLAAVDTTVLIEGESGTGKELVARSIHFNSPRENKPFVTVNCGAIPRELVESELFGYKKGAFTGAVADKKGKFQVADSGTVFLDEIGDLPLNMQVKLLRVLQEREIDVVGAARSMPVDVRIVAASNRDLRQMVEKKEFREDLYYRLSVAPLQLPPLRRRREDIPLLAHHFLEKFHRKPGSDVTLDPEVVETLQGYDWPGNVRELENVIEGLIVFARGNRIHRQDLPAGIRGHSIQALGKVLIHLPEEGFSLEELERDILKTALQKHEWNQTHTAEYLQITRNTLIYRMQKFGLRAPEAAHNETT